MKLLKDILKMLSINLAMDVGANKGQFGTRLRKDYCFSGAIYSFEPLKSAYSELSVVAGNDNNWYIYNVAVGATISETTINISRNSHSSSILPVKEWALKEEPSITYVGDELIQVTTLDAFLQQEKITTSVFLKVDTQGFELEVLRGALASISQIPLMQLELSLTPVYEDECFFESILSFLRFIGFVPIEIEQGWSGKRFNIWHQADVLFLRKDLHEMILADTNS